MLPGDYPVCIMFLYELDCGVGDQPYRMPCSCKGCHLIDSRGILPLQDQETCTKDTLKS